jgi:hypothetical protein
VDKRDKRGTPSDSTGHQPKQKKKKKKKKKKNMPPHRGRAGVSPDGEFRYSRG